MTPNKNASITSSSQAGEHKLACCDWGSEDAPVILCIHGLTCNGHDFDYIAPALVEAGYRVIAPDLPGRGRSDFLPDPQHYRHAQYEQDMLALCDQLGISECDIIGTSLGGLLAMRMAGDPECPLAIKRMILNDIGPEVPQEAADFIKLVLSETYSFTSIKALEQQMRATRGLTWGPITDEQWAHMAAHNHRPLPDGGFTYAYDPAINTRFDDEPAGEVDLWARFSALNCPLLLLRGGQSVLLTEEITQRMKDVQPGMEVITYKDCGHVPSLMAPNQIKDVVQWLQK